MGEWASAWGDDDETATDLGGPPRLGAWSFYLFTALLALLLFAWLSGLLTTLGSAEGSERHGGSAVRLAGDSGFGLPTTYISRGQKAWWDYDVAVEGEGGVRLIVAKSVPSPNFIVKVETVRATARGRFEVTVPESGFYSFSHELAPIGGPLGGARPGATRYKLKWGVS
jgi:hypothetical protein